MNGDFHVGWGRVDQRPEILDHDPSRMRFSLRETVEELEDGREVCRLVRCEGAIDLIGDLNRGDWLHVSGHAEPRAYRVDDLTVTWGCLIVERVVERFTR